MYVVDNMLAFRNVNEIPELQHHPLSFPSKIVSSTLLLSLDAHLYLIFSCKRSLEKQMILRTVHNYNISFIMSNFLYTNRYNILQVIPLKVFKFKDFENYDKVIRNHF